MSDYRRLLSLAAPHRWRILLATGITLAATALNLVIPANFRLLLDSVLIEGGGARLNGIALLLVGILVLRLLLGVVAGYQLEWAGQRIVADLRRRLFDHTIMLDLRFFADHRLGELTSRMSNDIAVIQGAVTSTISQVIERGLLVIGSLVLMLLLNWRLTLAIFVTMPAIAFAMRLAGSFIYRYSREAQDRLAAANAVMEESLAAIRVVKIFTREPHERGRFGAEIEALFGRMRALARLRALYGPMISMLFLIALVLMLWLGGREVLAGRITPGMMLEFVLYASFIVTSATTLSGAYSTFKRALGASERIFALLDREPEIVSPPDGVRIAPMRGAIRFEGVSFGYTPDAPILDDLSFEVAPGERVALVGPSGIGKSTLMDLIPRYYDVTTGRILVDGVDVRDADLSSLRAGIASVPQETLLFAASVRENLLYGRLDATDDDLITAARAANADDFVRALPSGYDTLVGERGVKLSGGQRQRIAIARALLKEPAILLLDEATSSLDSESERAVQIALDELLAARGRTTLVIAHRLSTIRNVDRILVLAPVDGAARIVEEGTHETLMARRGLYHQYYTLQFEQAGPLPRAAASG